MSNTLRGIASYRAYYNLDDSIEQFGPERYTYDKDGYLKSKTTAAGTSTYAYGSLGELNEVTLSNGDVITYKHNADNQRVAKLKNGEVVEKYLWLNLTTLLAVYDKDDNLLQRFEYADGRMPLSYMDSSGDRYYIAYNQIGSPRAVTNEDGDIVKTLTYDSFGNILHDSNPSLKLPFGFAGGLYDEDTGLTRLGYRDYDASTGKWTAKDPIGFGGGDTNLYGYVLGDPVNFVDPSGKKGYASEVLDLVTEAIIGETLAGGLEYAGMNPTMAGIVSEGVVVAGAAAVAAAPGGPVTSAVAAILFLPLGLIEGALYEALGLNALTEEQQKQLQEYINKNYPELKDKLEKLMDDTLDYCPIP